MTRINKSKINLLHRQLPKSSLLSSHWLKEQGITPKLAWWYVHSGWLEKVANQLYKKSGQFVSWEDVVFVLQHQLKLPLHVGGKTALELLGKAHYVRTGAQAQIDLYLTEKISLPTWLDKVSECKTQFNVFPYPLFDEKSEVGLVSWQFRELELQLSSPERAILELLSKVSRKHTYEDAYLFMENLAHLRPDVSQNLLEQCRSILAKRLFLHLAEKCQHNWFKEINLQKISLGSGKRKVGIGGVFDSHYQISVPEITTE